MKEVLRLIRFSLLLRLVPSAFGLVAGVLRLDARLFVLGTVSTLPSLVVLVMALLTERRNKDKGTLRVGDIKRLLGWAIFAYAIETLIPLVILEF